MTDFEPLRIPLSAHRKADRMHSARDTGHTHRDTSPAALARRADAAALADASGCVQYAADLGTRRAAEVAAQTVLDAASARGTLATVADLDALADDATLAALDAGALDGRLARLAGLRRGAGDDEREASLLALADVARCEADARALDAAQWQAVQALLATFADDAPVPNVARPVRLSRMARHRLHALRELVSARLAYRQACDSLDRERHVDARARKARAVQRTWEALDVARSAYDAADGARGVPSVAGRLVVDDATAYRREVERARSLRRASDAVRALLQR